MDAFRALEKRLGIVVATKNKVCRAALRTTKASA